MRCPVCNGDLDQMGAEIVCQGKCGSSFGLEYLGWYPEGSGPMDRIDEPSPEYKNKIAFLKKEDFIS